MTGEPLFIAIDVGTSGARAVVFDVTGRLLTEKRRSYEVDSPYPGWAEQDADDWAAKAVGALGDAVREVDAARVEAIGLTGQTPTVVPVDEQCRPLRPGMLYRDNRATHEAAEMSAALGADKIHARTGHSPAAFHVGPKILWLRRHERHVFDRTRWFLQPRDVVLHRLTGMVATDESHAGSTLFFDLVEREWADDILAVFDLDRSVFPAVLQPWAIAARLDARVAAEVRLSPRVRVVIGGGDSQCAAFGSGVVAPGPVSEMAGSSSCINTAVDHPVRDLRITHYSHVVPGSFTTEVGLNTTGGAIRWAVKNLGFTSYEEFGIEAAAGRERMRGLEDDEALDAAPIFVPHLGDGERDDPDIRGGFVGLADRHDRAALAFAVVEGVANAVAGEVDLLVDSGCPCDELRVAGGGARLAVLGQVKADRLGVPVRHLDVDTASLGAAMLAAMATGRATEAAKAIADGVARAGVFEADPHVREGALARAAAFQRLRSSTALHRLGMIS